MRILGLTLMLSFVLLIIHGENAYKELTQKIVYLELREQYSIHHAQPSDINEHLPTLRKYAKECSSIAECGVRNFISTWGFLLGLAENPSRERSYVGIDLQHPIMEKFKMVKKLAEDNRIGFSFTQANDLHIDIESVDLVFIDTLHTYAHLTAELQKFAPKARKYLIMHDTSAYFEYNDCSTYQGDYSEYPPHIDRKKRGLWPAVVDFLAEHTEWQIQERCLNNNGLTVLKRVSL